MNQQAHREDIIAECRQNEATVSDIVDTLPYQEKGVFNSELLFIVSACSLLDIETIIESGRARGYSTQFLAEFFEPDEMDIHSIELYRQTEDSRVAESRLEGYPHVHLHYGDATELFSGYVGSNSTVVLIDGPKGDTALEFAMTALEHPDIEATFVHDLHRNTPHRDWAELLFSHRFFTDDGEYIEQFSHLDRPCWDRLSESWQPCLQDGESIDSYASTLRGFFDGQNAINQRRRDNFEQYRDWSGATDSISTILKHRVRHRTRISLQAIRYRFSKCP